MSFLLISNKSALTGQAIVLDTFYSREQAEKQLECMEAADRVRVDYEARIADNAISQYNYQKLIEKWKECHPAGGNYSTTGYTITEKNLGI